MEAVDRFVANMHAYPGRTFGQLYHRFFRVNDLADGVLELGDRSIDLADVHTPVLSIAGTSDTLAPRPAVHAVGDLLPNAAEVRLETAPGGHLGVLTGRSAKRTTWTCIDEFFARHGSPARQPRETLGTSARLDCRSCRRENDTCRSSSRAELRLHDEPPLVVTAWVIRQQREPR